jgi:hypothetical protein
MKLYRLLLAVLVVIALTAVTTEQALANGDIIRATALRRNFCLYRSFHFLSTSQLLSCKALPIDFIR